LGIRLRRLPGLRVASGWLAALARRRRVGFNQRITSARRHRIMKFAMPFVVLTAALLATPQALAQRGINIQARTAGELADLCAANPKDAQGDAKINFCLGYGQGALSTELRTAEGKKTFCFPSPAPTRLATMTQFAEWVRALPDHKSLPAVDGFFRFLSERFPCK
jgi:hypothetical protein